MKTYIASPFFNKSQVEVIESIMSQLSPHTEIYSPMVDGTKLTHFASDKIYKNTYLGDLGGVMDADVVFGVLDYDDINFNYNTKIDETPMPITDRVFHGFDSGTIWELGVAKGLGKKILLYIPPNVKLNVMLCYNAEGYTTNLKKCEELFYRLIVRNEKFIKEDFVNEVIKEDKGFRYK